MKPLTDHFHQYKFLKSLLHEPLNFSFSVAGNDAVTIENIGKRRSNAINNGFLICLLARMQSQVINFFIYSSLPRNAVIPIDAATKAIPEKIVYNNEYISVLPVESDSNSRHQCRTGRYSPTVATVCGR